MSEHVVKKILAPGIYQKSIIKSLELPMPHFPKPVCHWLCIQVLNSIKVGLKKDLKLIFKNR